MLNSEELGDFTQDFAVRARGIVKARGIYYRDASCFLIVENDLDRLAFGRFYYSDSTC